jgi:hypothetical protein
MEQQRRPNADDTCDGVLADGIDGVEQILYRYEDLAGRDTWQPKRSPEAKVHDKETAQLSLIAVIFKLITDIPSLQGDIDERWVEVSDLSSIQPLCPEVRVCQGYHVSHSKSAIKLVQGWRSKRLIG